MTVHAVRRTLRSLAFAGLTLSIVVQPVAAAEPTSVRATTSNPYAACSIGSGGAGTVNYAGAEVEPSLAVNPAHPRNLIGVVQQDRWNDGGAHGLVALVSRDGGKSFRVVPLPFSSCAPGGLPYERASDPWVSIGPDGTAYAVSISFDENSTRSDVAAATSTDGGMTWGHVREIAADTTFFHDKESVTADPRTPGTAYVVWDRSPTIEAFPEPSFISKTTDFGHTWSAPRQMTASHLDQGDIGNVLVVDRRNGTLYDFFYRFYDSAQLSDYMVIRSTDGGQTWSDPISVAQDQGILDVDPHPGGPTIRTAAVSLPEAAIDPATGQLYMVWEDARYTGGAVNQVVISTSSRGTTWSAPRVVSTPTGQAAFTPSVAVNAKGQVAVSYYDFRSFNPARAPLPTDFWLKISSRGGRHFSPDIRLTDRSFDMLKAPDAFGLFVGDYEGLAASGTSFVAIYCTAVGRRNNPTDCFVATVPGER